FLDIAGGRVRYRGRSMDLHDVSSEQGGVYRKMPYVDDDFAMSFGKYPHVGNPPILGDRQELPHPIPGEDSKPAAAPPRKRKKATASQVARQLGRCIVATQDPRVQRPMARIFLLIRNYSPRRKKA